MSDNNATSDQKKLIEKISNNLSSLPDYFQGVIYGLAIVITTPDMSKETKENNQNDKLTNVR